MNEILITYDLNKEILKELLLKVNSANDEEAVISALNKSADCFSYEIKLTSSPYYEDTVQSLVDIIECCNNSDITSDELTKLFSVYKTNLNLFVESFETYNPIEVEFSSEALRIKYSPFIKDNFLNNSNPIYKVLLHDGDVSEEGIYDETYNIEEIYNNCVKSTYLPKTRASILFKNRCDYLKKHPIKTLSTGSSYSVYSLNEDMLPDNMLEFSQMAQDLYYSYKIIEMALECNSSIENIIISIGKYNFFYDISRVKAESALVLLRDIYYPYFKDKHNYEDYIPLREFSANLTTIPFNLSKLIYRDTFNKSILDKIFSEDFYLKNKTFYNEDFTRELDVSQGGITKLYPELDEEGKTNMLETIVNKHNKMLKYTATREEYEVILEDILRLCNKHNISPVFFVSPKPNLYRDNINPKIDEIFCEVFSRLKDNYDYSVLDYEDDLDFIDEDFVDAHHLSTIGSVKMTSKLKRDLPHIFED